MNNNRQQHSRNQNKSGTANQQFRKVKDLKEVYKAPKTFLREKVDVVVELITEKLDEILNDYSQWRRGKKKRPEYIFNMMQDFAIVSALPDIYKENEEMINDDFGEEFSEILSNAINELARTRRNNYMDMVDVLTGIYEDLNEVRITEVVDLDIKGIEWDEATSLCIASHGNPSHTMINTLRTIYSRVGTSKYDDLRRILKRLFGKEDMPKVAVYILLEKKQFDNNPNRNNRHGGGNIRSKQYDVLTKLALDELEDCGKKKITDLLKLYCDERRRTEFDNFIRRRINFATIDKDNYPRLLKRIKKLSKKGRMYRSYLDMNHLKRKKRG